jgi:hypothetical protein
MNKDIRGFAQFFLSDPNFFSSFPKDGMWNGLPFSFLPHRKMAC